MSGGWWVIPDDVLLEMLTRVEKGTLPGIVFAEYYANCDHQITEGGR